MTKLSVNVNKIGDPAQCPRWHIPDVVQVAIDCQLFELMVYVHPRPDQRHIRTNDVLICSLKLRPNSTSKVILHPNLSNLFEEYDRHK